MRIKKSTRDLLKRDLELNLQSAGSLSTISAPRQGWLKAIRESLGISTRQLGSLLGIDNAGVLRLEARELQGKATLEAIERAAQAMECRLVYAIIPKQRPLKTTDSLSQLKIEKELMLWEQGAQERPEPEIQVSQPKRVVKKPIPWDVLLD